MKITTLNNSLKLTIVLLALIGFTNCAPSGFQTSSSEQISDNNSNSNDGLNNPNGLPNGPVTNPIANLDLKAVVDSDDQQFGGALAFDLDKVRGEFIIMLPLPSGVFISPSGAFSKYPDITFSPIIDAMGRMKFAVRIPVKYILKGVTTLPPSKLPNGDALPAMPQGLGELPSLALSFPQHNNTQISLYLGVNAIGLFVTLPDKVSIPLQFTLPIKNRDKTKIYGYLTYVPPKINYAPGLFVSTLIPANISRILEDYFKL